MILGGDSLFLLECQPASYAILACNEAEKEANIKVIDYRMIGANGRLEWIAEEIAALTDPAAYEVVPDEAWRRLKPKRNQPRYLAMLQAVAAWREREAMDRDLPRNRILRDDVLSQIAARPPDGEKALSHVRGVPRNFASGKLGKGLLAAIEAGRNVAEADALGCWALDLSSGVERRPGDKDLDRVEELFAQRRGAPPKGTMHDER